jgi:hypothetical protein
VDPIEIVDNPDFIEGIFNYCDRWCERCAFTNRCANFALGEEHFPTPEDRNIHSERFWEKLHDVFQQTRDMLGELLREQGIELTEADLEAATKEDRQLTDTAESHECVRAAEAYATSVNEWFDSAADLFSKKGEDLDLEGSNPRAEINELNDAVEVIRWYQYPIQVKLIRAVRGSIEDPPEILEGYPSDSDGSAKVALIGLDRSLAAWGLMRNQIPDQQDKILDILIALDRLRRRTEACFPNARDFIRPGFDDPANDSE